MLSRLDSWKEIAKYLSRDVRTVQRWERRHRLPVHRLPGAAKPRVYALASELDEWMQEGLSRTADSASVAVLPFLNLIEGKENEYFGDGLADEIITALARVRGLRVIARTSSFAFRDRPADIREIGRQLKVEALLEGSVRRSGGRVRICAQLVSTRDGCHLWSESYDREFADIFEIQNEIARAIVQSLRVCLARPNLVEATTRDPEAYDMWLKGKYAGYRYTPEDLVEARSCYKKALARDTEFPLPYVATAELLFEGAHFGMVPPAEAATEAKQSVLKAILLNDNLGEAYALLGAVQSVFEYDWAGANRSFQRALDLSPGSVHVLRRHAWHRLVSALRFEEAIDEMRLAEAQDPLSPLIHMWFGLVYIAVRDYKRAEEQCRMALELAGDLHPARWFLGTALIFQAKPEAGLAECRRVYEAWGGMPMVTGGMILVYGLIGLAQEARSLSAELFRAARSTQVPPIALAWAYLGLKDDQVFEWLNNAIDGRDPAITHLAVMPMYDGIRHDSRFRRLLSKIGLDKDQTSA